MFKLFPKWILYVESPPTMYKSLICSINSSVCGTLSILSKPVLQVSFSIPNSNDTEECYIHLFVIYMSSSGKYLFKYFTHSSHFFSYFFYSSLYIWENLCWVSYFQLNFTFILLIISFTENWSCNTDESHLYTIHTLGVMSKNTGPNDRSQKISSCFIA